MGVHGSGGEISRKVCEAGVEQKGLSGRTRGMGAA